MQAFAGVYQLVSEVASGGMATVYLAIRHGGQGFEKCCAIKRIHPHLARDKNFSDMFIDEARITASLSHPCVCGVFDFGSDEEGSYYIAMEFLRGETLSHVIGALAKRTEAMGDPRLPRFAARIIADLAEGLHAAHTAKNEIGERFDIVHRDVTPQNLFVLYDGSVRVSDFGIARARSRLHVSGNSELKGSCPTMAPEQLDRKDIDHARRYLVARRGALGVLDGAPAVPLRERGRDGDRRGKPRGPAAVVAEPERGRGARSHRAPRLAARHRGPLPDRARLLARPRALPEPNGRLRPEHGSRRLAERALPARSGPLRRPGRSREAARAGRRHRELSGLRQAAHALQRPAGVDR